MRVLFSCSASDGHFLPLVPLAQAFAERGDDVAFATAAGFARRVAGFGFEVLPAGLDGPELNARYARFGARLDALPFGERRPYALAWRFAELDAPAKLDDLLAGARAWAPELIVHETADVAAPVVAAALDVPTAHHTFGRGLPPACLERLVPAAEPLWTRLGLEPDPFAGLFRGSYIDVSPPSLEPAAPPDGTQVLSMQPVQRRAASAEMSERLRGDGPVVYVTLGTQFNEPARFSLLLEALALVDRRVVMTVGANRDPTTLEAPPNVIVERYIPQGDVLPLADAVLCHGGSGSLLAALTHALPLVLLPAGADQFENAEACRRAGAAIDLLPPQVTVDSIRSSVNTVLADPAYAEAAKRLATEVESMLTPSQTAAILG